MACNVTMGNFGQIRTYLKKSLIKYFAFTKVLLPANNTLVMWQRQKNS